MTVAVRRRGEAILARLGIEGSPDPGRLARGIVPANAGAPFVVRLRSGLEMLLHAVAGRSPELAAAASERLVGVGPGRTPLGDDYLAAVGLTVARLGGPAGFAADGRDEWLAGLLPARLAEATTPYSARLLADAVRGRAPAPAASLLRPYGDDAGLARTVARLARVGATSGRGWAAGMGATAVLLCERDRDRSEGDAPI